MALLGVHRAIINFTKSDLIPVAAEERDRFHARDEVGRNARAVIEALRAAAARAEAQAEYIARQAMDKEQVRHKGKWTAVIGAQAKIDVSLLLRDDDLVDVLSVKSEQFNALIKNMSADLRAKIERETLGAIFEGRGNRDIAKAIEGIDGVGRRRARLIARDQASKLNGAMNQFRQEQAGVTFYKWKTILDGRERPEHHAKNGKVYPWAGPQEKPGQAINCRCRGIAILIDDEEAAAKLVAPEPEPFDFEAALPKMEAASSLYRTPLARLDRETLLIRKAELANIRQTFEALRSASTVTEAEAERLFQAVFGFPSDGQDLSRMTGSVLLATRRSQLFAAVRSRLDTINEMLEHAAETAPAVSLAKPPDPLARKIKKGQYFERTSSDAYGDEAIVKSREFVQSQGQRTGTEWGVLHDEDGRVLAIFSSNKKGKLHINPALVPELFRDGARVTFHHNHPNSTSFSVADVKSFEWAKGQTAIYAHGHDGSSYRMTARNPAGLERKAIKAFGEAKRYLQRALNDRRISLSDANQLHAHAQMLIMAARGEVGYSFTLAGSTKAAAERAKDVLDGVMASVAAASLD